MWFTRSLEERDERLAEPLSGPKAVSLIVSSSQQQVGEVGKVSGHGQCLKYWNQGTAGREVLRKLPWPILPLCSRGKHTYDLTIPIGRLSGFDRHRRYKGY
jgi:hypothetical protein